MNMNVSSIKRTKYLNIDYFVFWTNRENYCIYRDACTISISQLNWIVSLSNVHRLWFYSQWTVVVVPLYWKYVQDNYFTFVTFWKWSAIPWLVQFVDPKCIITSLWTHFTHSLLFKPHDDIWSFLFIWDKSFARKLVILFIQFPRLKLIHKTVKTSCTRIYNCALFDYNSSIMQSKISY